MPFEAHTADPYDENSFAQIGTLKKRRCYIRTSGNSDDVQRIIRIIIFGQCDELFRRFRPAGRFFVLQKTLRALIHAVFQIFSMQHIEYFKNFLITSLHAVAGAFTVVIEKRRCENRFEAEKILILQQIRQRILIVNFVEHIGIQNDIDRPFRPRKPFDG